MPNLTEQMIEECAKIAERVRDHAASRIEEDGSILDYLQKIRKETAEHIAKQIRELLNAGQSPLTPK